MNSKKKKEEEAYIQKEERGIVICRTQLFFFNGMFKGCRAASAASDGLWCFF
jgi:hypothetical protein